MGSKVWTIKQGYNEYTRKSQQAAVNLAKKLEGESLMLTPYITTPSGETDKWYNFS